MSRLNYYSNIEFLFVISTIDDNRKNPGMSCVLYAITNIDGNKATRIRMLSISYQTLHIVCNFSLRVTKETKQVCNIKLKKAFHAPLQKVLSDGVQLNSDNVFSLFDEGTNHH